MWDTRRRARAADGEPRDDHREAQRKRLRRRAGVLAVAEAVLVLFLVYKGFRPHPVWVAVLVLALTPALQFGNVWTAEVVHRGAPPPSMPKLRAGFGVAGAVVVAVAVVAWVFTGDVEAARTSSEAPEWRAKILRLEEERSVKLKVAEKDLPNVDQDPAVQRLQQQLDDADKAFWEARRNELCEEDGTCGTRVRGRGKEYYEKVEYRVQIGHRITELSLKLTSAKETARGRADKTSEESRKAAEEVAKIDSQLERLRSSPPEKRSRASALLWVSKEKSDPVLLVWVGALISLLVIDLLLLRGIAWHVYRRDDGRDSRKEDLAKQREIDERRSRAKPYVEGGERP